MSLKPPIAPTTAAGSSSITERLDDLEDGTPAILWVDYTLGSDSNSGLWPGPGGALKTLSAAETALPATRGGTIMLAGGVHDMAARVTLTKCRRLIGVGSGVSAGGAATQLRAVAGTGGLLLDSDQRIVAQDFTVLGRSVAGATGTGNVTSGSPTVGTVATSTGTFAIGQKISGRGIPGEATISNVVGATITLSVNAVETNTGVSITGSTTDVGIDDRSHGTVLDRVMVKNFGSHGVYNNSASDNANSANYRNVRSEENWAGNGFFYKGSDSNACHTVKCEASDNGGYGFENRNNSNRFDACEAENNKAGAARDAGDANKWDLYVEGTPSVGQNVDLASSTRTDFWGQEFGVATLAPAPGASVRIVDQLLKVADYARSADVQTLDRALARTDTANLTTGTVYAARAVVMRTASYSQIRFYTGSSTPNTLTDVRLGVWDDDGVTKLAETANVSASITVATTGHTFSLSSPISLVAGDEVFLGLGFIGTTLNVMGKAGGNTSMQSLTPVLTRSASGWVTGVLPNLSAGTLQWMWVELIP